MPRYTLYRGESSAVTDATDLIREAGASTLAARPGLVLIEATEQAAAALGRSLPDWRIAREQAAQTPTPRPKSPLPVRRAQR